MKTEYLPICINGITERENYSLKGKDRDKIINFYKKLGFTDITFEHISPAIGQERDEVKATMPDKMKAVGTGGPWIKYIMSGREVLSVFCKKAPWDYDFFARK